MILKSPTKDERIPDAITTRHIGRPKLCWLVAPLFRLPKILKPRTIMDMPRKTNPDSALSIGQCLAKYPLKSWTSETRRKMLIELVMKWETPSKKKN